MDNQKNKEFLTIINPFLQSEEYLKLQYFYQHIGTTRLEHCVRVAKYSYLISKRIKIDYISCTRAAMLHDFFLYDRKEKEVKGRHPKAHALEAANNANKYFSVNKQEIDAIQYHMWPLIIGRPHYSIGWIVQLADKIAAVIETSKNFRLKVNYSTYILAISFWAVQLSIVN